jgi:hypothetical protein
MVPAVRLIRAEVTLIGRISTSDASGSSGYTQITQHTPERLPPDVERGRHFKATWHRCLRELVDDGLEAKGPAWPIQALKSPSAAWNRGYLLRSPRSAGWPKARDTRSQELEAAVRDRHLTRGRQVLQRPLVTGRGRQLPRPRGSRLGECPSNQTQFPRRRDLQPVPVLIKMQSNHPCSGDVWVTPRSVSCLPPGP